MVVSQYHYYKLRKEWPFFKFPVLMIIHLAQIINPFVSFHCYLQQRWRRYASLSPGSIPGPGAVHAFSFQFILASAAFSPSSPVFLLHLELGFLNKSISGIIWSYKASANWQLIWHWALSPSGDMLRVTKTQIYLFCIYFSLLESLLVISLYKQVVGPIISL